MKTFPLIAFLAALGALLFAPLNAGTAWTLLFAAGLGGIFLADYNRGSSVTLARPASVIRLAHARASARTLELAA